MLRDDDLKADIGEANKSAYKLFDFFANCEYFEEEFDYDEVLQLPSLSPTIDPPPVPPRPPPLVYTHLQGDAIASIIERRVGYEGMRIDRMFFDRFADIVRNDAFIANAVEAGQWDLVIEYVSGEVFNKPTEHYTLDKLRRAAAVDRRLTIREILEKVFDLIPKFKSKDELLEEEFAKFVADSRPESADALPAMRAYFKAYAANDLTRHLIDSRQFTDLATNPDFTLDDLRQVPELYRSAIPDYVKDYVSLNQFAA